MKNGFLNMARVFRREWSIMLHDPGLLLFFIALPLLYPVTYTLIYNTEVVRKVSVVVVDDCRTSQSRQLVQEASAAPAFKLYGYAPNMADAKEIWANHDAYAILHIPHDFDKKINSGEQSHATLFCDMSLLLRYRALFAAMTNLQIKLAEDITSERVATLGAATAGIGGLPIESRSNFMGDTQQGFASFVIPGIVVLILHQSLILGAALLGASSKERRRANGGIDPLSVEGAGAISTVWGKALAYIIFYIPATIYVLRIVPWMFSLPQCDDGVDYLLFILPMLLAAAFLGQAIVVFMKEREYVFLVVVISSVFFLFLSGLTWPRYAMSRLWVFVGDLVPATWGVEGFIRINSNGASLAESAHPYTMLWVLAALYCVLAIIVERHYLSKSKRQSIAAAK